MAEHREHFSYDNQNFFQLASIQSASLGFPMLILGQQLAKIYGAGTAIASIALGNLILWLVAIAMISMADRMHYNAIENIKSYIGGYGGKLFAIILMFAFLNWYAVEINGSMEELNRLLQFDAMWRQDIIIRFGAALGLFSAMLAVGGIRLLKRITVISLPFLICYTIYATTITGHPVSLRGSWGLSFPVVLASILSLLPGVINFPTFFRHSRSRAHSYFALTILTLLITFFEVATIWMRLSHASGGNLISLALFIIVTLTCCNLLNIYLASAAWETVVPRFSGSKGYAIIGLLGTLVYTFVQISSPVQFLQDLTNCYIGNLGVVLLMAYLVRIIVRHRPRTFEKIINMATWAFGCIIATIYETQHFLEGVKALLAGVNASILFFLCVIFIEETVWATRTKLGKFIK